MLDIIKSALMTIWKILKETFIALRKIYLMKRIQRYQKKANEYRYESELWFIRARNEYERYITKYEKELTQNVQDSNT